MSGARFNPNVTPEEYREAGLRASPRQRATTAAQWVFRRQCESLQHTIDSLKDLTQKQAVEIAALKRDIADRDADPEPDEDTLLNVTNRMEKLIGITDAGLIELHRRFAPFVSHDKRMETSRAEIIGDIIHSEFMDKFAVRRS